MLLFDNWGGTIYLACRCTFNPNQVGAGRHIVHRDMPYLARYVIAYLLTVKRMPQIIGDLYH
jgi:hypothetical protein